METKVQSTGFEKAKCGSIIHTASAAAGAAGVLPIGPADTLVITPIQIGMVISLGKVYGFNVSETVAKSILAGLAASFVGRMIAKSFLQFIPIIGWALNFTTAAGLTEAIGWAALAHFHKLSNNQNKSSWEKYEEKEFTNTFTGNDEASEEQAGEASL